MDRSRHADDLRRLLHDPSSMSHFMNRAHRLRAEAYAGAWRWLVGLVLGAFPARARWRPSPPGSIARAIAGSIDGHAGTEPAVRS